MEDYPETQFRPGNAMIHMNPTVSYSEESAGRDRTEANNASASQDSRQVLSRFGGISQMQDIQDFGSWRDQESGRNNGFQLTSGATTGVHQTGQGLSLSLGSQILPGIHQMSHQTMAPRAEQYRGNEYATQSFQGGNQNMDVARTIPNSKYLKAAQQLLDEAVNVRKALREKKNNENPQEVPDQNPQDSSTNPQAEISPSERQEMQSKLTKLLSMLDEVDRRYKQYYQQMQIVVSSFDVIAGYGAAKPYTALALQTISRHFRSLRDAISGQILVTRKCLGEQQDGSDGKRVGIISRLKYVDQHLRQQRGFMQPQAWRPQRGLPENSVLILRAWLFEHFLHPYPKDSDKIMLARQTGLSRGQVSNWFINARVRLWKPMVEEIYKEEFTENDSNSSSENTPKMSETGPPATADEDRTKPDHGHGYGVETCGMVQGDQMDGGRFMAVEPTYHVAEMSRFGGGGVSLTLGLQNSQGRDNVVAMSSEAYNSFPGVDIYENAIPGDELEYVNPGSRQSRISSSQLVHDFVD
ncbi:unnamed protein product [Microthlaspi erraticum]|uniref:Homeobox domain-containing protein n=1 Tax=Microthlaspi erraticum TaxID=1685480 RepID=A0A6D2HZ38_9BRAS|nr:unnamed protein product [Microthlaspi erraticum]